MFFAGVKNLDFCLLDADGERGPQTYSPWNGGLSLVVIFFIPWDPNPSTIAKQNKQTNPRKGGFPEEFTVHGSYMIITVVAGETMWNPCTCWDVNCEIWGSFGPSYPQNWKKNKKLTNWQKATLGKPWKTDICPHMWPLKTLQSFEQFSFFSHFELPFNSTKNDESNIDFRGTLLDIPGSHRYKTNKFVKMGIAFLSLGVKGR